MMRVCNHTVARESIPTFVRTFHKHVYAQRICNILKFDDTATRFGYRDCTDKV